MKKTDIDNLRIAIPGLFDYSKTHYAKVDGDTSGLTTEAGIHSMYSDFNGKKLVLDDINGMVRMMSQAAFFNQSGGYYTYDIAVAELIGGYPKGAILKYEDEAKGEIRTVRSLTENNKYNFIENSGYIDGEHWEYVDNIPIASFRQKIFPRWDKIQSGTLSTGAELLAKENSVVIIQSGTTIETTSNDTEVFVYVDVKNEGQEKFHSAAMLAYVPPVSSAYSLFGQSAAFINDTIEKLNKYTAWYSSSPIQIFLGAGDRVRISTNVEFSYSSQYVYIPLDKD